MMLAHSKCSIHKSCLYLYGNRLSLKTLHSHKKCSRKRLGSLKERFQFSREKRFLTLDKASVGSPSAGPWFTHTLCFDSNERSWKGRQGTVEVGVGVRGWGLVGHKGGRWELGGPGLVPSQGT